MSRTDDLNMPEEEHVTLGQEAAQSVTVQFYYKGYSILLTSRDPSLLMKPLLEKAMKTIDICSTITDMKPSWNTETNKANKEVQQQSIPVENFQEVCNRCGAKKILSKKGNMVCSKYCWVKK